MKVQQKPAGYRQSTDAALKQVSQLRLSAESADIFPEMDGWAAGWMC